MTILKWRHGTCLEERLLWTASINWLWDKQGNHEFCSTASTCSVHRIVFLCLWVTYPSIRRHILVISINCVSCISQVTETLLRKTGNFVRMRHNSPWPLWNNNSMILHSDHFGLHYDIIWEKTTPNWYISWPCSMNLKDFIKETVKTFMDFLA